MKTGGRVRSDHGKDTSRPLMSLRTIGNNNRSRFWTANLIKSLFSSPQQTFCKKQRHTMTTSKKDKRPCGYNNKFMSTIFSFSSPLEHNNYYNQPETDTIATLAGCLYPTSPLFSHYNSIMSCFLLKTLLPSVVTRTHTCTYLPVFRENFVSYPQL